ncbi:alpha/beta fold hydrolase [Agromyces subbeticus]|uniref:alpha/beta fold hydrolase n=1 Tax=Agromyces subbeticus TaxID=293890 RepID=UPI0003B63321|nr:alpha/beta hydrolase [Agromyces subbeticus]
MLNIDQRLPISGCSLAFADSGGAEPAVLFLHGAGADHVMFADQAEAVAATGRRVVLVDLRGHGRSRPNTSALTAELLINDATALIAALELERPVLVGHSLGGNLAQAMVRLSPGDYSGLAVLDSTWNTGPLNWFDRQLLRLAAPGLALIPAKRLARVMAAASATSAFARRDAERAFGQVTKAEFLDIWRATTSFVAPDASYRTPLPLCLVRGADDRTGNIATAMPAWARHDGVVELVVPNAGHIVSQDAAASVTAELLRFLASIGAAQ